jgi:uncharacterized membrane protein
MSEKNGLFEDKRGLDRMLFFSDAVMAIAITLLVMDLRVTEMARGLIEASFDQTEVRRHLDFARRGTVVFVVCLIVSIFFPVAFFPVWFLGFLGRSIGRRIWKIR